MPPVGAQGVPFHIRRNSEEPLDRCAKPARVDGRLASRNLLLAQSRDGGTQMGLRCVPELHHQRMPLEGVLNDAALDAPAATVDHTDFAKAGGVRGADVFLDDGLDVARRKRMEVDDGVDRYPRCAPVSPRRRVRHAAGCVAVTIVLIPPRTVKSPTTFIRRGWHAATRSSRISLVTAS